MFNVGTYVLCLLNVTAVGYPAPSDGLVEGIIRNVGHEYLIVDFVDGKKKTNFEPQPFDGLRPIGMIKCVPIEKQL